MKTLLIFLSIAIFPLALQAQDSLADYSLTELDVLFNNTKNPKDKLPYALAMLNKGEKELDKKDTSYAEILFNLGNVYSYTYDFNEAIFYLEKAIDIQKVKIPSSETYANSLSTLGIVYYYERQLDKVEPLWLMSANIKKEVLGEKDPMYTKALGNLGVLYLEMVNYDKAEFFFVQCLNIQKEILEKTHPQYATSLGNLGLLYKRMGLYEKAEQFYLQTLNIRKEVLGKKHPEYARSVNNLAVLYDKLGNYRKAEPLYLEALNIRKEVLGERHPDYAASLGNLGVLYTEIDNNEKAEYYYLQALNIQKEVLGEKHPEYARSLSNLGLFYKNSGNYEKSEHFYLQALNIQKEVLGEKHPSSLMSLNNLASLYKDSHQEELSWEFVIKAIKANTNSSISKVISRTEIDNLIKAEIYSFEKINISLFFIYELLAYENQKDKQILICDAAFKLLERNKNGLTGEEDKLRILEESSEWVKRSLQVLNKTQSPEKALNVVEQNKSVLLLDATSNKQAYLPNILPDSLIQQEKALQKQYSDIKGALVQKRPKKELDSLRSVLTVINLDIDNFQKLIQKNYPKYVSMRYSHDAIKTTDIQSSLDKTTALLEYLIGDSIVYIFYVDKTQIKIHEFFIDNKALNHRIKSLHHALSNYKLISENKDLAYKKYIDNAHWFYKNLIAPVLSNAKGIEQLLIVSDGELGHLPFETFLVEQASQKKLGYNKLHYLINDYNISYNYSATLWKENKEAPTLKNNGEFLAIAANYNIQLDSSKSYRRLPSEIRLRKALNPLPAARKEVETLQETYPGLFLFDTLASEKLFKEKAANFAVIHLAMHGLLNKKEQVLSNLAFTEVGDSFENNFLCAYEISKMELNSNLVVLSACETGYGKFEKGNGIASLARAFMYAGASALIVSLWQVSDYATSEIMKKLYKNLANGMNKDKALREAKLAYMKSAKGILAHPAFWSPFIMLGNTQPLYIKTKGGTTPWVIGGLVTLLVLGAGLAMSKHKKEVA